MTKQKQHLIDMIKSNEKLGLYEEQKQETLVEAAEKYVKINVAKNAAKLMYKEHFIAGAKWQQERICDSKVIQRIRASKSDAEARRIIRTI